MMTDYPDQPGFLDVSPPLDEMALYGDIVCPSMPGPSLPLDSQKHFAFTHQELPTEDCEMSSASIEGISGHYIPHDVEHDIHSWQAASQLPPSEYPTHYSPEQHEHQEYHLNAWPTPATPQPSPVTMSEFFQLMSQPENVQAYMQFLQTQHEAGSQRHTFPAPSRNRSNSQPIATNFPVAPANRAIVPDVTSDSTSTREQKLAKFRAKRARRLTSSAQSLADSTPLSASAPGRDVEEMHHFMPTPKIQKTFAHDLENRLMTSEEENRALRNALESQELELQLLRQAYDDHQRHMYMLADSASNASSSACNSPRPRSPSTPALVSSPSNMSLGSSTMDADFGSLETSSMGSDHMLEMMAHQKRQEKLKKLGGPPSDVYHPWWNGISLNHPAFQ